MAEGGDRSKSHWYVEEDSDDSCTTVSTSLGEEFWEDESWSDLFQTEPGLPTNPPRPRLESYYQTPKSQTYQVPRPAGDPDYQVPEGPALLAPTDGRGRILPRARSHGARRASARLAFSPFDVEDLVDLRDSSRTPAPQHGCPNPAPGFGEYEEIDDVSPAAYSSPRRQKKQGGGSGPDKPKVSKKLKVPAAGLAKLGNKLAGMKDLGHSFKSMLNLRDEEPRSRKEPKAHLPSQPPIHVMGPAQNPVLKNAYMLYIDGPLGVGKSTLIESINSMLPCDTVACFGEPMTYWKHVFNDCVRDVYKLTGPNMAGKHSTSAKLLSTQMKFAAPMNALKRAIDRCCEGQAAAARTSPLDCWAVFDRHPVSATVVFPFVFLKKGLLSFQDFLALLSTFTANSGDILALLTLEVQETVRRLKARRRAFEDSVDTDYVADLASAYHRLYCSWLLLQYLSPEQVVEICFGVTSAHGICAKAQGMKPKTKIVERMFAGSLFAVISDMISPFVGSSTLVELCYNFCLELKKLTFLVVDATPHTGDCAGLWTDIYMQALRTPSIKTRTVDWQSLKILARDFSN